MSDYAVSVKNVSKKFNLFHEKRDSIYESAAGFFQKKRHSEILQALDDVSFNVKHGEIFGIIGRNGDGKTTLLRIISKIYNPDSGSVDVRGSIIPILAIGLGFHPELTAISNIYQSSILLGFNKNEITKRIPEIIKFAELERFADTKVKNFSNGMQLRLAFGDINFQKKCLDTIMSFKKRGKAIIFVSHSMGEISKFCDTVMFLKEGKVGNIGSPAESIAAYQEYLAKHPEINPKENLSDSV